MNGAVEIAAVGDQMRVDVALLNVREDASPTAAIVTQLTLGATHTVVDGPVDDGGSPGYCSSFPAASKDGPRLTT